MGFGCISALVTFTAAIFGVVIGINAVAFDAFDALFTVSAAAIAASAPTAAFLAARGIVFALARFAAFAPVAPITALSALRRSALFFLFFFELVLGNILVFLVIDDRFELGRLGRTRARAGHAHLGAFVLAFGHDFHRHAVAMFDLDQIAALFVEQVDRRFGAGTQTDQRAFALGRFIFDQTQR